MFSERYFDIYLTFSLDVAQDCINGAPNETQTHL